MNHSEHAQWEQALSKIGAKIADAADLVNRGRQMTIQSEAILAEAQKDIEALYVSLEDSNSKIRLVDK